MATSQAIYLWVSTTYLKLWANKSPLFMGERASKQLDGIAQLLVAERDQCFRVLRSDASKEANDITYTVLQN